MPDATHIATVHPIASARPRLELKVPFAHLVPPLSGDERTALELDLIDGQDSPVLVDEESNILDGHNRYEILEGRVFVRVITGLSLAEKEAFVFRKAEARRNLSADQRTVLREQMRAVAFRLRAEDPQKNTQQRIADKLGVKQQRVSEWFSSTVTASGGVSVAQHDSRVKFTSEQKVEAVRRVLEDGEKAVAVAAELGMSRQLVSKVVVESKRRIVGAADPVAVTTAEAPKRKVYSAELKANVIRRLSDDESPASISADLNLPRQAIAAFVEEHKLRSTTVSDESGRIEGTRRIDTDKRDQAVLDLHNQNIGSVEIARRLGITADSVSRSKCRLGIAANSPGFKLWNDVVHATDSLAGSALALELLTERIASSELQATGEEIGQCCKSLGESIRVAKRLLSALKAKTP